MIKNLIILIWCLSFWGGFITGKSVLAGEWNDKPVICEMKDIALKAIRDKGEILLISGVQSTKVRSGGGLAQYPIHLPLHIYVNLETKTYTIIEYHPTYESVCIISYGDDFSSILLDTM